MLQNKIELLIPLFLLVTKSLLIIYKIICRDVKNWLSVKCVLTSQPCSVEKASVKESKVLTLPGGVVRGQGGGVTKSNTHWVMNNLVEDVQWDDRAVRAFQKLDR